MGLFARPLPSTSAFPRFAAGRLLHHPFRGLHSVHYRYSLQTCQVAYATLYTGGFSSFVTSTTAPIATGWNEQFPGGTFTRCEPAPFHGARESRVNTSGISLPDRVADGRLDDAASRQLRFDITAFRRTECNITGRQDLCHYGNSPSGQVLDFSIFKNWKFGFLGEQGRIQFRSEFFNLLNHPNFGQPNGISFATSSSVIPDGVRNGETRGLRNPMRAIQFAAKIYF